MSILSSGALLNSQLIFTGRGVLYGLNINPDGVNPVTIICYDNIEASGKIIWKHVVAADSTTDGFLLTNTGILCSIGLYVSIVGGAPSVGVLYRNNAAGG